MATNQKKRLSSKEEIPEVKALYEAVNIGVEYLCKKFKDLENPSCDTDPNDVVRWVEKSFLMAQNVIAFHELINKEDEEEFVRGGARVNKFEIPNKI
jgi:hypothetical protein